MSKNYVNYEQAMQYALSNADTIMLKEIISIEDGLGRVLSQPVTCQKNLPSFNNSAMDGFAVKSEDVGKTLKVKEIVYAGDVKQASLCDGECYKIMTGAQVPSDADTIVPIEQIIIYENNEVTLPDTLNKGYALRLKGEEAKEGETLFEANKEITAGMIAVLASQGIVNIEVYKKLSIAVVSTGSELKEPWEKASEDEIFNCNSYGVIAVLKSKGFEASYIKVIPDNLEDTIKFVDALKSYDIIITSGGISMGDADFVGQAFEANGLKSLFDGVNIKPGKPLMMGKMNKTFVICLPGNPLTAIGNLYIFALPVLRKIQGFSAFNQNVEIAVNQGDFKTRSGRVNLVLGKLEAGKFYATRANKYGAGMITVIENSNAILLTHPDTNGCLVNDHVKVISFDGNYLSCEIDILN